MEGLSLFLELAHTRLDLGLAGSYTRIPKIGEPIQEGVANLSLCVLDPPIGRSDAPGFIHKSHQSHLPILSEDL